MENLIVAIVSGIVDDKDAIQVTADAPDEEGTIVYHLHVGPDDMGRVIAKAIRTVVRAAASKQGVKVAIEID